MYPLEYIMLREISQLQKDILHDLISVWSQIVELIEAEGRRVAAQDWEVLGRMSKF